MGTDIPQGYYGLALERYRLLWIGLDTPGTTGSFTQYGGGYMLVEWKKPGKVLRCGDCRSFVRDSKRKALKGPKRLFGGCEKATYGDKYKPDIMMFYGDYEGEGAEFAVNQDFGCL
jgi:hypothetical protein